MPFTGSATDMKQSPLTNKRTRAERTFGFPFVPSALSAWRDELDISDAKRILREMSGSREEVWHSVAPYLTPGRELKARYAFDDLWESTNGET